MTMRKSYCLIFYCLILFAACSPVEDQEQIKKCMEDASNLNAEYQAGLVLENKMLVNFEKLKLTNESLVGYSYMNMMKTRKYSMEITAYLRAQKSDFIADVEGLDRKVADTIRYSMLRNAGKRGVQLGSEVANKMEDYEAEILKIREAEGLDSDCAISRLLNSTEYKEYISTNHSLIHTLYLLDVFMNTISITEREQLQAVLPPLQEKVANDTISR
jgi:hypothetical protein